MTSKYSVGALVGALTLAASFCCVGSSANAITLHNGDVALFNFDFTGQVPPPPYAQLTVSFTFNGAVAGASGTFDFFNELNGGGAHVGVSASISSAHLNIVAGPANPGIVDGIFSVRLTAFGNPFEVLDVAAIGFDVAGVPTPSVPGEQVTPLPAALPLFASGAGALGFFGWRRKKKAAALAA